VWGTAITPENRFDPELSPIGLSLASIRRLDGFRRVRALA
jgi:hypothetical protein